MYNTIGRWQFVSSMEIVLECHTHLLDTLVSANSFLECLFPLYIHVCMHV